VGRGATKPGLTTCFSVELVALRQLARWAGQHHAAAEPEAGVHRRVEALPWADDLPFDRGTDWRGLQRWLLGRYTLTDVLTDTPLPPDTDPAVALDLIRRGREELAQLLQIADAAEAADAA
jgi:hypothetical protein